MSFRVLQFGATGQLAREMLALASDGLEIVALSRAEVDLTDADAIARACQARGLPMIHISTDMVFSGAKAGAYVETDPPAPLHVYGASKLVGELGVLEACDRALIARVSWLFSAHGQNFLQMMLKLARTQPLLKVVDDQRARPTSSADVAAFLLSQAPRLARAPAGASEWGLLHLVNDGEASRYEMAQAIFELAWPDRAPPAMEPVPTSTFPTPARRALNAVLDTGRLKSVFGLQLRPWREALEDTLEQLAPAEVSV